MFARYSLGAICSDENATLAGIARSGAHSVSTNVAGVGGLELGDVAGVRLGAAGGALVVGDEVASRRAAGWCGSCWLGPGWLGSRWFGPRWFGPAGSVPAGAVLAGAVSAGAVVAGSLPGGTLVADADEATAAMSATPANAIVVLRQWRLI